MQYDSDSAVSISILSLRIAFEFSEGQWLWRGRSILLVLQGDDVITGIPTEDSPHFHFIAQRQLGPQPKTSGLGLWQAVLNLWSVTLELLLNALVNGNSHNARYCCPIWPNMAINFSKTLHYQIPEKSFQTFSNFSVMTDMTKLMDVLFCNFCK